MRRRTLHPALQRLAALVLLGVGLGIAVAATAYPLAEALAERRAVEAKLAKYERVLQAPEDRGPLYDPDDLSSIHLDEAEAQIALQSTLDRVARSAGVAVQSVRPLAAEYLGDVGKGVWVDMTFSCDLQALVDLLQEIEALRPVLLIRRLDIEKGDGPRPDIFLRVTLHVGRAWRAEGSAS